MPERRECANAIRVLAIDAIEKACSGHPGAPLGMADIAEALWNKFLRHNPKNPDWPDRDRFVLSNGHASMLLYGLLHLSGYEVSMEDLRNFRQWQSKTPGHPEVNSCTGVEMTTGPLGQGIASAVGMALAEAMLAAEFNKPGYEIVNHYTYVFCGEGCLMEGVSHEACSLAGTWKLGRLIVLFDANGVSIDGAVQPWFSEDVRKRFEAYGWQVLGPIDGHDFNEIDAAIDAARKEAAKPSLIICKTHIGFGSPKRDSNASHGAPLGPEAAEATRKALGWQFPPFVVPQEIYESFSAVERGEREESAWNAKMREYAGAYPELAEEFRRRIAGELPLNWESIKREALATLGEDKASLATRVASKKCLEIFVPAMPGLIGGSADLSGSVGTLTPASKPLDPETHLGNYLYYGVREFGMGAIMNGLALHGGFIPYAGTFLAFSDQAKNALRLSALMRLRVIWVFTHDSIGVGEDGPTHQPIEQLPTLRLIPNMNVWRPCDNIETAVAWICALESDTAPTCLVLSRQGLPYLEEGIDRIGQIQRGGYIFRKRADAPDALLIASGSEVALALEASEALAARGIQANVISMPCLEIFERQDVAYKESVLPESTRVRVAIEAARPDLWYRLVGLDGQVIGMEGFGFSAPGKELFEKFGFTVDNVASTVEKLISRHN